VIALRGGMYLRQAKDLGQRRVGHRVGCERLDGLPLEKQLLQRILRMYRVPRRLLTAPLEENGARAAAPEPRRRPNKLHDRAGVDG
jgi:hypothetical protein